MEDRNKKHNETLQKTIPSNNNTPFTTPSKMVSNAVVEEENKTPIKMGIPVPSSTPSTVSVPMQTAMTPAAPHVVPYSASPIKEIPEEIEYSFEERRAGFVLPLTHLKTVVQQI